MDEEAVLRLAEPGEPGFLRRVGRGGRGLGGARRGGKQEEGDDQQAVRPGHGGAPFCPAQGYHSAVQLTLAALLLLAAPAPPAIDLRALERDRVLKLADAYLKEPPVTVTASSSPRSPGQPNEFFSEGDYWWPDPANPGGPYVRRDGQSNPDNFVGHRQALMRMSRIVPALTAAWLITGDARYSEHAARHLRAWFVDPRTRMAPHLRYAQAVQGRWQGRGVGIIDTIHLVEVARAIEVLEKGAASGTTSADEGGVQAWFSEYLRWMTTDPNGIEEREAKNNHGTCWVMQVAAYSWLTANGELGAYCRDRFRTVLVPNQIAPDGSFPLELARTKPYGYSLFNLDALATTAHILSRPGDSRSEDLWRFETADGRGLRRAMAYMVPFIRDRKKWPFAADVMYDDQWPMRQASLFFAGLAYEEPSYLELWKTLPADSNVDEVIRNFFVRQPVLWVEQPAPPPKTGEVRASPMAAVEQQPMAASPRRASQR